ncbi:transposase [Streptomyces sp. NPDC003035]|uniref:transposase n=1 Tax=Streptomyces sp. NPDC003035 TaxID=3364676 RepID=UPI00367F5441
MHLVTDRSGLPVAVAISVAHTHDSLALKPLVASIPPIRSRRGPAADGPTSFTATTLAARGIAPRIARRGIETSQRLGRSRWVIERTMSWLVGCRRLDRRYDGKPEHFLGFAAIATSLIDYRRLTR